MEVENTRLTIAVEKALKDVVKEKIGLLQEHTLQHQQLHICLHF